MGALLFILYVNDITYTSNVLEFVLFADDTTITYSHSEVISKFDMINNELQEVTNWFKANKLSVNAGKTNCMLLGTNHKLSRLDEDASIILDNTNLKRVNDTKFLGVTIDENLNWTNHIETISKNISMGVGIINKLKHFVPEGVLYSLYCTLILPYINYGIIAWGCSNKSNLDRIMKLQKKAVRIMSNSHYLSHSAPLFNKYNLLNVYDIYLLEVCTFMYKEFNNKLPDIFHKYFNQQKSLHKNQTRHAEDYEIPHFKTNFARKTIRATGPTKWNLTEKHVKEAKTIRDCFHRRIRLPNPCTGSVAVYGYITKTRHITRSPYTVTEPIHRGMVR